jgi:hypothetical protein
MQQPKENRAHGDSQGAVGNDALAGSGVRSPYSESRRLNLVGQPQAAGNPRRLIPTVRHIQVVHHYSAAGVRSWHVVLTENASRKSVAAFGSKHEAIGQLGFFSQKLQAQIVGRRLAVTP